MIHHALFNDGHCASQYAFQLTSGQASFKFRRSDHCVKIAFVQFNQCGSSFVSFGHWSAWSSGEGTLFFNHEVACHFQSSGHCSHSTGAHNWLLVVSNPGPLFTFYQNCRGQYSTVDLLS